MKRYLTIINLLLTGAVIYLSVDTFYKITATRLDTIPAAFRHKQQKANLGPEAIPPPDTYKTVTDRNLFNTSADSAAPPKQMAIEALKKTALKLKLWGTVAGDDGKAYAVIEDAAKREQNLYRVGDTIQNAAVKMILREKVVLHVSGKDEILSMEEVKSTGTSGRSFARRPDAGSSPKQKIVLKQSQLAEALQDTDALMKQARVRPHFKDGKPDGLMVTGIRPDSIFRKMGLRNGDILVGVDEADITSADDALKFYEGLKSSSEIKLQIKRRGRTRTLEYTIE